MSKDIENVDVDETDDTSTTTPMEWFDKLVEENKEDTDFLANAIALKQQLVEKTQTEDNTEAEKIKQLEEDNRKLKQSMYEKFTGLGAIKDASTLDVEEEPEDTTLSINELISQL